MKVAITGKGGVGKTTLSSTLARLYAAEGRTVLAADVDPDANLGLALGLTEEEVNAIVPISKMRQLVEERTGATYTNKFFKLNPQVSDIPDKFARDINGVKLLVMGTVEVAGSGCVCPEHVILKRLISHLVLQNDDVVIMDMEAAWSIWAGARPAIWTSLWWSSSRAPAASRPITGSRSWPPAWGFTRSGWWPTRSAARRMRTISASGFPPRTFWALFTTTKR